MKIFFKVIKSGLLILIFSLAMQATWAQDTAVSRDQKSLEFQIMLPRESFQMGKPVLCFMYLVNHSEDSITVKSRMAVNSENEPHDVFFRVYDPSGKRLDFWPEVELPSIVKSHDFKTISPGSFVSQICRLDQIFKIESTGTYKIQAVYSNCFTLEGMDAWIGTLESNCVEITIQE